MFQEFKITIDIKKLGLNGIDLIGTIIGEANSEQAIIGKSYIVLLEEQSAIQIGSRGIVVFESAIKDYNE